jgi:plasmid stabilization system protein ParE
MSYHVRLTTLAESELVSSALWWAEHRSPEQALRWLDGFEAAIRSLAQNPESRPLARESGRYEYLPAHLRSRTKTDGQTGPFTALPAAGGNRPAVYGG